MPKCRVPVHIFAALTSVETILNTYRGDIHEGDLFLACDPYYGGSHVPDWTVVNPIFIDGAGAAGRSDNGFRMDWLAAYEPTPGTAFYLGYGSTLQDDGALRFRNLRRADDGFFLKASYLIRR